MPEMNIDAARHNMVEGQIRTWAVLDPRILDLTARAPRHEFVPEAYRTLAFADMQIPLAHGQVMMAPKVEARLIQALAIRPNDKILEIGTGSGYVTWLLAKLGASVHSVELYADLSATAQKKLSAQDTANVTFDVGDAAAGWGAEQAYDVIFVGGSLPILPERYKAGLSIGGRLAVIVGLAPAMEALLIERLDAYSYNETSLFETVVPALVNAKQPERFVF